MKTLAMYRPSTIQNALSDFDRYLESFLGTPADRICGRVPAVDIKETGENYVIDMELPGYDEKNIEVSVDGSNLSVASKQEEKAEENAENYILRERRQSSFSRSFKLPENANPEAVKAVFKNGVLSLHIEKRAEAHKKAIQINAA